MLTLTERERQAYAGGNLELAELIACVIDGDEHILTLQHLLREALDIMTDEQRAEFTRCHPSYEEAL